MIDDDSSIVSSGDTSASAKRPLVESEVPHPPRCKKRKKTHHWSSRRGAAALGHPDVRRNKCTKGSRRPPKKPEAPFNSTQFIMEEHDCLNETDLATATVRPRPPRQGRRRHDDDSSPSERDSDEPLEDDFFWPPDDQSLVQENFMSEQFWTTYHDLNAERLNGLSKAQLVQEYLGVEEKLNILERELVLARTQDRNRQRIRAPSPGCEDVPPPGEVPVDAETAAKIEVFRNEIDKLSVENDVLRSDNEALRLNSSSASSFCRRCALRGSSSNSSDDEDGSSSSSSGSYVSDSSSEETATKTRKLLLSSLSPPTAAAEGGDDYQINVGVHSELKKTTVDLVSDSGIASASSGDDLRLEDREEEETTTVPVTPLGMTSPFYAASV